MTLELDFETRGNEAFRAAVVAGFSRPQKTLPSAWLYDERGSELFNAITRLDAYYPTRAETEILSRNAGDIARFCGRKIALLDYGAGAGVKTEILIGALVSVRLYVPIDIAGDELARTTDRIAERFPGLDVFPVLADFTSEFDLPTDLPAGPRAAFFPGSTIGNLDRRETTAFLKRMRRHVEGKGPAIIGLDLKKDRKTLLNAYDDSEGVTAAFNLNLLERINRELDGDFPLDRFVHEARWNEADSAVEMHLVSLDARRVAAAGQTFVFAAGESIHTESSRKYDLDAFAALAGLAGWRLSRNWRDRGGRFAVVGLEPVA
jgi:dimethylhistidine N-methyltransferase